MHQAPDPRPVIRAVLLAGFFSGNVCGILYMAARGVFLEAILLNPLAMFGAFLFIGLLGLAFGAVLGLFLKLILDRMDSIAAGRWIPIVSSASISALTGTIVAVGLGGYFFP